MHIRVTNLGSLSRQNTRRESTRRRSPKSKKPRKYIPPDEMFSILEDSEALKQKIVHALKLKIFFTWRRESSSPCVDQQNTGYHTDDFEDIGDDSDEETN